jgi:hypothetical protein
MCRCRPLHGEYAAATKCIAGPAGERVAAGVDSKLGEHLVTRERWTSRARAHADS